LGKLINEEARVSLLEASCLKLVHTAIIIALLSSLLLSLQVNNLTPCCSLDSAPDFSLAPSSTMAFSLRIVWPSIGKPAIVLNGSQLAVRVTAPSSIGSWTFSLYREYREYALSYGAQVYNSSNGEWTVNVTIPNDAARDLYDLHVWAFDGVSNESAEEWNAVQVRPSYPSNFKIFHITDTHLFSTPTPSSQKLLYSLYQAAMANADLVIITGDLTDDGILSSFVFFREILRQSRVPTYLCPGNHDRDATDDSYGFYMSVFGADYFATYVTPDIFLVSANTHRDEYFNSTQLGWIRRDMAASTAQTKILAFHHPLYNVEDPPTFYLQESEALDLLNITQTYGVDVVLTGHLHNDRVDYINGTRWILTTANGGSVWLLPTDPGTHRNGFRILEFENYQLVAWNWTLAAPCSQPWDEVELSRGPNYFHTVDMGMDLGIINHLNYSLPGQIVDVLLTPLTSPAFYHVTGATVLEMVNSTDAWFARLLVDLPAETSTVIRVFTNTPQAPVVESVEYTPTSLVNTVAFIYANVTNPASGVLAVNLNYSLNGASYSTIQMDQVSPNRYRFYRFFDVAGSFTFQVLAWDYSGLKTASAFHTITLTYTTTTTSNLPPIPWPLVAAGVVVGVVAVLVVVVVFWWRPRSSKARRQR
jgi:Icc protein